MMANNPERSGCLGFFLKLVGVSPDNRESGQYGSSLPRRLRDNFLSAAELAFYLVLEQVGKAHQQQGATVGRVVRPKERR